VRKDNVAAAADPFPNPLHGSVGNTLRAVEQNPSTADVRGPNEPGRSLAELTWARTVLTMITILD
jgi:hypothetical protein